MLTQSMHCCLNPDCLSPINPESHNHCQNCGVPLVGLLYNRFKVIKPIGRGGFGKTYLAEDVDNLNRQCVVKQLAYQGQSTWATKKAVELFEQEAKQLALLSENPQIPTLFAYFKDNNYMYLVQQFIEGEDLLKQLEQRGQYSEVQIQQLLIELLPVLQFIHDREVIHRDIKPENIMRQAKDGKLFLIDFGVSKLISPTLAGTGSILGSYGYSPLEQIQHGKVVYASDLFALGATCFHMLSGIPPQQLWAERGYDWMNDWQRYLPQPIASQLGSVLDKLLKKDAPNRYQSAAEVLKDLQAQTIPLNPTALLTRSPVAGQKRWMKKSVLVGAGVAALAAIGLVVGIPKLLPNPHATRLEVAELNRLAENKSNQGKNQEALEDLNKVISLDPNNALAYSSRGLVRSKLGNTQSALEDFNKAISLDPKLAIAYRNRGILYDRTTDLKAALEDYNKAIELDPNDVASYIARGNVREKTADLLGALADYNQAIKIDSKNADIIFLRGLVHLQLRNNEGALEDSIQINKLDPNNENGYLLRGKVHSLLGENQKAFEDYSQGIKLNPNNADFYSERGSIFRKLGNNEGALEDFNKAILLNPRFAAPYVNRGIVRRYLDDFKGAHEDFTKAIEFDPHNAVPYSNRGAVRNKLGDTKGANEDFSKAIELKPDFAAPYTNRGETRTALGDKKGAIEDYQKAASLYLSAGRTKDYQDALYRVKQLKQQ